MIVECLVTTQTASGELNVAPMGPRFPNPFDWSAPLGGMFRLSPFEPSRTLQNLQSTRVGVLNFTDNVLMLAQMALKSEPIQWPQCRPAKRVPGQCLQDAARCWEFEVVALINDGPRWHCDCRIVNVIEQRPMVVFNRAMHAVIEATILATRIGIVPDELIRQQINALTPLVEKTAGPEQWAAWNWVEQWIERHLPSSSGRTDYRPTNKENVQDQDG
jgi:hypothetical protein